MGGYRIKRVDGILFQPHHYAGKQGSSYSDTLNCANNPEHHPLSDMQNQSRKEREDRRGYTTLALPRLWRINYQTTPRCTCKTSTPTLPHLAPWQALRDRPRWRISRMTVSPRHCLVLGHHTQHWPCHHHTFLVDGIYIGSWCLFIAVTESL